MGHQFDYQVMTDASRDQFRRIIGDRRPWRSEGGNSPHEQFAEAYMLCSMNSRQRWRRFDREEHRYGGSYGYFPTVRQDRLSCWLIAASWLTLRS